MTGVEGLGVFGLLGVEGSGVEGSGVEGLGPVQASFSPVSAVLVLDLGEESDPFTLIGVGGDPPYVYAFEWIVQPDPDITFNAVGDEVTFEADAGIAPGDYAGSLRGTVTDQVGQEGIAALSVMVTVLAELEAVWDPTDITEEVEAGNDSTSAEVLVTGGLAPYTIDFDWVGGVAPDPDITIVEEDDTTIHLAVGAGITPDTYTGTVRATVDDSDGHQTTADLPIEITVPAADEVNFTVTLGVDATLTGYNGVPTTFGTTDPSPVLIDGESLRLLFYQNSSTTWRIGINAAVAQNFWTQITIEHAPGLFVSYLSADASFIDAGAFVIWDFIDAANGWTAGESGQVRSVTIEW